MMDLDVGLDRAAEALPIFPLPRTVLMPGALLPLHVFEPRYRALVAHCRAGWEIMGIATLMPGYEADYDGRPALFPEVGVGRILAYQPLEDGRSNILLHYIGRGRILEELPANHVFREVRLQVARDVPPPDAAVYDAVRSLVRAVGRYSEQAAREAERLVSLEGSQLVDTLARKLLEDVDSQRRYLATDHLTERARMVEGALADVLAAASPGVGEA
jgi:uncharacterized protein